MHIGFGGECCGDKPLEDLGLDGRTILKWILNEYVGSAWTRLSNSGKGQVAVFFKQGNKHLDSVKCGINLD